MPKYEIMLIIDPSSEIKVVDDLAKEVFKEAKLEVKEWDRKQLAYPINKTQIAKYILINVNSSSENVKEFSRRANIMKNIWRYLVINLENEKKNRKIRKQTIKFENKEIKNKPTYKKPKPNLTSEEKTNE